MKRFGALCLTAAVFLRLWGCGGNAGISDEDVRQFFYQEVLKAQSSITPGVRKSGFKNTSKAPVHNAREALKRAEKECTVDYTDTMVSYDGAAGIWRVDFYKADRLGGGQSVYLDENGVTKLVVCGE